MRFNGNDVWCTEVIDSICQFMQRQLSEKAAEWMLLLPANAFTQLEKLRSLTVVLCCHCHCYILCLLAHLFAVTQITNITVVIHIIIIVMSSGKKPDDSLETGTLAEVKA